MGVSIHYLADEACRSSVVHRGFAKIDLSNIIQRTDCLECVSKAVE